MPCDYLTSIKIFISDICKINSTTICNTVHSIRIHLLKMDSFSCVCISVCICVCASHKIHLSLQCVKRNELEWRTFGVFNNYYSFVFEDFVVRIGSICCFCPLFVRWIWWSARLKRKNKAKIITVVYKISTHRMFKNWKWNNSNNNYARQSKEQTQANTEYNNDAAMNSNWNGHFFLSNSLPLSHSLYLSLSLPISYFVFSFLSIACFEFPRGFSLSLSIPPSLFLPSLISSYLFSLHELSLFFVAALIYTFTLCVFVCCCFLH